MLMRALIVAVYVSCVVLPAAARAQVVSEGAGTASDPDPGDTPVAPAPASAGAAEGGEEAEEEASGGILDDISFNVFFSFEFELQLSKEGNGDTSGSFDSDVLEVLLQYQRDRFRLSSAVDFEHGTDTEEGRGAVQLAWAYLEYSFNDSFALRAGKFLNPFGIYNEIHGAKGLFLSVKEPLAVIKPSKLSGNGFRYTPRWEAGLGAAGRFELGVGNISYDVIVGNGENTQTNPFEEDNNKHKSVAGKVRYMPMDELTIAVSGYTSWLTEDLGHGRIYSVGGYATYSAEALRLTLELAYGLLEAPGATDSTHELGLVAEVGYVLADRFTPYIQWQRLDTGTGPQSDNAMLFLGGVNVMLGTNFRLKAEYNYAVGSDDNAAFVGIPGQNFHEVKAALVGGF